MSDPNPGPPADRDGWVPTSAKRKREDPFDRPSEPIEQAARNLNALGKDKYEVAAELKLLGYKVKDIAKTCGVSLRDIGVKLKASDSGDPEEIIELLTKSELFKAYGEISVNRMKAEILAMLDIRMQTMYLDKRAAIQGFHSTADYIKIATNFYDLHRDEFATMYENNEVGLPMLEVME